MVTVYLYVFIYLFNPFTCQLQPLPYNYPSFVDEISCNQAMRLKKKRQTFHSKYRLEYKSAEQILGY